MARVDDYWETRIEPKLDMIENWARAGMNNKEISMNLGISWKTLNKYCEEHPELAEKITTGRDYAEILVESALFRRALGYSFEEKTMERAKLYDSDGYWTGEYTMINTKTVSKHIPADVQACIYWLERRSARWNKLSETEEKPIEITITRKGNGND